MWARSTQCILQFIGIIWREQGLEFFLVLALLCLNFAHSLYLTSINAMHFAIYWRNLVKCARFRIFFSCQLYFVLTSLTLYMWARSTSCILQCIGIIWREQGLEFFLVLALLCLNFAHSLYLTSINAMHFAIYWRNLVKCARFRIFFSCQLYFVLTSLTLYMWARSTSCILQCIGVIWSAPDLDFFSLVSFTLS